MLYTASGPDTSSLWQEDQDNLVGKQTSFGRILGVFWWDNRVIFAGGNLGSSGRAIGLIW